ncbi:MAG: hypothetical protein L6R38_002231 [Xanthoria sp. 2 TBL-2021]|nr:MAG: hypothetical protein L6R38_002231 [Xanthoria sp. 2 TBL-2021]
MLRINVLPGPYTAGSPVSGTIALQGDGVRALKLQTIKITFSGRCKTKITESSSNNNGTHHRGRVTLFQYEMILFNGPYSMNPSHEWPYHFIFPERCQSSGLNQFKSTSKAFNEDRHQPLPGSFGHSTANFVKADMEAFVRYELEAALVAPPGSRGGIERTQLLTFRNQRHEANPDPRMFFGSRQREVQSLYLSPEYQYRLPTFKEKFKAGISWGKLPEAHYVLKALLPTVGVLGRPVPLLLGVTYNEEKSTTASALSIFLRNVKVQLVSRTTVRCVSDSIWSSDDVHQNDYSYETVDEQYFTDRNIELANRFDVAELMDLTIGGRRAPLVPSFKTFNIIRTYVFRVYVTTECGKKKDHPVFNSPEFVVMTRDYSQPGPFPFATEVLVQAEEDDKAVLPSYEAAVKS